MPIYEYQCQSCGHQFETLQRMSEDPLTDCPACQAVALKKLISPVAFKLKGQGWYESDFKNSTKKSSAAEKDGDGSSKEQDSAASKTAASDGSSASEAKSEGKSTDGVASQKSSGAAANGNTSASA